MNAQNLIWSPYQKQIFWDIQKGRGHSIIEARAGASKTTSLVEGFRYLPRGAKTIVLAFNKIIQKELEERAPHYVQARTFHSLGMQAITQRFKKVHIDDWKVFNIVKEFPECEGDTSLIFSICDTIAFCKYGLLSAPNEINALISRFGIDLCDLKREDFIRIVIQALGKDKLLTSSIDFNDMCYFPFVYDLELGDFDIVFVDEFQDLSKNQWTMARKLIRRRNGRIIATGDSFQDLYSWRLSDNETIKELKEMEGTKVLSLPISYRCPQKVIELVKPWVPDITCPDTAKEGSIETISLDRLYEIVKPGCFILSRTNAPLIKICLSLIKQKIKANIRGKNDIGKQLSAIVKRSKKKLVPAFLTWLEKYKDKEIKALITKGVKTDNLMDKYECLVNLCEGQEKMTQIEYMLRCMFSDTDEGKIVQLSSVHGAKGLERDTVFLLRWTFRGWFDKIMPDMIEDGNEELNIAYVAATRTKDKLYLVNKN
jgi:superfamily I DNA/RNA helicase